MKSAITFALLFFIVAALCLIASKLPDPAAQTASIDIGGRGGSGVAIGDNGTVVPGKGGDVVSPVQYDSETAAQNRRLDLGDAGMSACMDRAISGLLGSGIRDRDQLTGFAAHACGAGFSRQLQMEGASAAAADAYVSMAAAEHLDDALRRAGQ